MSGAHAEEYARLRRRLERTAKAMLEVSRRDLEPLDFFTKADSILMQYLWMSSVLKSR